jgi:hypothetical protein
MAGLKKVADAIKKTNDADDRCTCGHKKRMHVWALAGHKLTICKVASCYCKGFEAKSE